MLPDRVSNPGPLTYESGALPIVARPRSAIWCLCLYNFPSILIQHRISGPQLHQMVAAYLGWEVWATFIADLIFILIEIPASFCYIPPLLPSHHNTISCILVHILNSYHISSVIRQSFLCPRRNFGGILKSNRQSVRQSVTNRVSAISHKLLKQI